MKIYYDNEVDALYIELNNIKPDACRELENGVNMDLSPEGKIIGIEILDAFKKN